MNEIDELTKKYYEIEDINLAKIKEYHHMQHEFMMYKYKYNQERNARVKKQKIIQSKLITLKNEIYDDTYQIKINQLIDEYEEVESSLDQDN